MTPTINSLWHCRASACPLHTWRLERIDGDRYVMRLVQVDPNAFDKWQKVGDTMVVDRRWFDLRGIPVVALGT